MWNQRYSSDTYAYGTEPNDFVKGLRSGGVMLLEAYTPTQLEYKTGGHPTAGMMMDMHSLMSELAGLEFLHLQECVREVYEGEFHNGVGAVVQALARKP